MLAQASSGQSIAVTCTGSDTVPRSALSTLCADLLAVLAARYPDADFQLTNGILPGDAASVTLETFISNSTLLDARLTWQRPGSDRVNGPRMSFSISDAALTPKLQQQFLNRLVQDTALPL